MEDQQYLAVESRDLEQLIEKVNSLIKEGWKPLGGIACAINSGMYHVFVQALIRSN